MKDFIPSQERKRKNLDLLEARIFQLSHIIKNELESGIDINNIHIKKITKEECGHFVYYIINKGKFYAKINIDLIKYFLNKYTKYGNFEGDKEFFLTKLSVSMHIEPYPKDYLLFRKNDIGDKFYIILKGSVAIVITQEINIDMTEKEYNTHIEKLRFFKEYYLLDVLLSYDNKIEIKSSLLDLIKDEIYLYSLKQKDPNEKVNTGIPDINPQKFVERVEPIVDKESKEPKLNVKIPIYKIVATLKIGDTFGEIALSKTDFEERKRTATVITDTDSVFGVVPNNIYSTFLKEIEEKNRYTLVSQLVSHSLFKKILPESFLKANYLNFFNNMTFKGGNYLIKQGEVKNSMYFIFDGVINLYTELSIDNIIQVIENLNKDIPPESKKDNNSKSNKLEEFDLIHEYQFHKKANNIFTKFCKIKRTFKIFNINKKETLGFDDCLLNEDRYFTSAKIMSDNCHVFVLKLNFLNSMLKEKIIARNYQRTNIEKKKIMINRLTNMVKMIINRFLKNHKMLISEDDYLEQKKKNENSILKSENISFKKIKDESEKISFSLTKYKKKNGFRNLKFNGKNLNKNIISLKKKNIMNLNFDKILFEKKLDKEKYKTLKYANKKIQFKNKFLNFNINFSNDNIQKPKKFFLPNVKAKSKKDKNKEKCQTEIIKTNYEDNINNNIIPNIKKLSTEYIMDNNKLGKSIENNMTQFDFLFYDNFFVTRGNKQYSKEQLESND